MIHSKSKKNTAHLFMFICSLWLLFLMHLPVFNSGGSGFILPQNILTYMVVACMCCVSVFQFNSRTFVISPTLLLLVAGSVLITMPVLWCHSTVFMAESMPRYMGLWSGVFFYACVLQIGFNVKTCRAIIFLIVISACIESIIVLQEIFLPQTLNAFDKNFIAMNGRGGLGTFQQVNLTASWLATGLAACIYMAFACCFNDFLPDSCQLSKGGFGDRSGFFYSAIVVLLTLTLVLTRSRTGWLGGSLCCLVLFIFIIRAHFMGQSLSRNGWLIVISPLAGLISGLIILKLMNSSPTQVLADHAGSNYQRLLTLSVTWDMIKIHPVAGWGVGTFKLAFQQYISEHFHPNPSHELMAHPHNEILYIWFEGGVVALAGFILCLAAPFRLLFSQRNMTGVLLWVILFPIILHTQLEFPLYYSSAHFIILLLVMAMMEPVKERNVGLESMVCRSGEKRFVLRAIAVVVTGIVLVWLGRVMHMELVLSKFEENKLANPDDIMCVYVPSLSGLRYKHDMNTLHLIHYYDNHQSSELEHYLVDNAAWLKDHPDPDDYDYQIRVLSLIKRQSDANAFRRKAGLLFPWDVRFDHY